MSKIFHQMNLKFEAKIGPYQTYSFAEKCSFDHAFLKNIIKSRVSQGPFFFKLFCIKLSNFVNIIHWNTQFCRYTLQFYEHNSYYIYSEIIGLSENLKMSYNHFRKLFDLDKIYRRPFSTYCRFSYNEWSYTKTLQIFQSFNSYSENNNWRY